MVQAVKKALSQNCAVEVADYPHRRWARLAFSNEEVDCINLGTNELKQDWNKIKL